MDGRCKAVRERNEKRRGGKRGDGRRERGVGEKESKESLEKKGKAVKDDVYGCTNLLGFEEVGIPPCHQQAPLRTIHTFSIRHFV